MSLFQLREWWRTKCGNGEEFDNKCMDIGNVDNDQNGELKVAVGSFQVGLSPENYIPDTGIARGSRFWYEAGPRPHGFGASNVERIWDSINGGAMIPKLCIGGQKSLRRDCSLVQGILRVFCPRFQGYSADHLLMEMNLKSPILQLQIGRFTSDPGLSLAILHPRSLVVYRVVTQGGIYTLSKCYEHALEHVGANFVSGQFGGQVGSDLICVQVRSLVPASSWPPAYLTAPARISSRTAEHGWPAVVFRAGNRGVHALPPEFPGPGAPLLREPAGRVLHLCCSPRGRVLHV